VEVWGALDMGFTSILFDRPAEIGERAEPAYFGDLNLDQLCAAIVAGRAEYDLAPFFRIPLRDAAAVGYRHEVFRDLENETVSAAIAQFTDQMRTVRRYQEQGGKLRYKYQNERWLLDAASVYCAAVTTFDRALGAADLRSDGLAAFRDYLAGYAGSAAFTGLAAAADRVSKALDDVRYCVNIKGNRVSVTRYEDEADYSAQVTATFAKFAAGAVRDYRGSFRNWPEMGHVEERILDRVAALYPDVFRALDEFCARHGDFLDVTIREFDRQIQFYRAYLEFIAPMTEGGLGGLRFCYPEVSADSKEIRAEAAFDLALAARLVPQSVPVVTNDFRLSGPERIFVVTGPNHGGKTTFARMLGQLHYLASLGCLVPASQASLYLPDQVFTHFEREEDLAALHGKLEEELLRIREVLTQATGDSLLVMNESFASTTLRDARFIGERVLDRMTELGLLGVYVTFVDELASRGEACVSMVGTVVPENPAERTFKVVRRPADGLAYAAAIAAKYGLTYRQLTYRLPAVGGGASGDGATGGVA
jgi:DNA mismatch repair protein MutS